MVRRDESRVGFLKVIEEFSQAARIFEKEPAHHRLKSCGLSVKGGVLVPRSPSGAVAAASHQALLPWPEVRLQPFQSQSLGFRPHFGDHLVVEITGTARPLTALQPLVQLPHSIAQPGELEGVEIRLRGQGRQRC